MSTVSICAPSADAPQPLRGRVFVGQLHRVDGERERQLVGQPAQQRLGQIGELFEWAPLHVQALEQLPGPVLGLAEVSHGCFELGQARVVTRRRASGIAVRHAGATSRSYARSVRCTVKPSEWYRPSAGSLSAAQNNIPVSIPRSCTASRPAIASGLPEPRALRARIDADHVDLAEPRIAIVGVVQLEPVEAREPVGVERQQEQRGIEPRLGHTPCERRRGPAALLGVAGEGAVVDIEPGRFVAADLERAHARRRPAISGRRASGSADPHLVEVAVRVHSGCRELRVVVGTGAQDPQHEESAAVRSDVTDGRAHERAAVGCRAGIGRNREAERPVPGRVVVAAGDVRVAPIADEEARGIGARMLEIEPDPVVQRGMPGHGANCVVDARDLGFDLGETGRIHLGNGRFGHTTRVP